jgi:hypothetical protein
LLLSNNERWGFYGGKECEEWGDSAAAGAWDSNKFGGMVAILAGKRLIVVGKHRYGSPFTSRLQYQMAGKITRVTNIHWLLRMRTNCVAIDGISMDWKKLIQIKEII